MNTSETVPLLELILIIFFPLDNCLICSQVLALELFVLVESAETVSNQIQ